MKRFELFNGISKIVPWNAEANDPNFEKVAYGGFRR